MEVASNAANNKSLVLLEVNTKRNIHKIINIFENKDRSILNLLILPT